MSVNVLFNEGIKLCGGFYSYIIENLNIIYNHIKIISLG